MVRWYFPLLLLCLTLQDQSNCCEETSGLDDSVPVRLDGPSVILYGTDLLRQELVGGMAIATPQAFPGNIPWGPMHDIGTRGHFPVDFLIHYHPQLFLEMCLERYKQKVTGYSAKFYKRERIGGKLGPQEKLEVQFREQPFSVYMKWVEGPSKGQQALYVAGENNGKLLARGGGLLFLAGPVTKDVDGPEAKKHGRYTIDQFGIFLGTQRSLAAMRQAQERGTLNVTYEGRYPVPELGDRECYKFVRTPYVPVEEEGVNELTIWIDKENWLQVGSVLKDAQGHLIAEYFFRDLKINPEFKKDQFTRAAL